MRLRTGMHMKPRNCIKSVLQMEWFQMLERFQAYTDGYVKQEVLSQTVTWKEHIGLQELQKLR